MGIVGVVLGYVGILLGPVAVALGVIGYRNTTEDPTLPGRTTALVGSILGGVAVVTGIASLILFFWVWNWTWSTAGDDFVRSLDETARELEGDPFGRSIPDDVQITADCVVTEDNLVRAEGTLTNTGSERRSFDIEVEVHSGSEIHGYTNAEVDDVAPGETVSWKTYDSEGYAPSTHDPNAGPVPQLECEVDNVDERFVTP
ncbi:MAG: UbiA family prenyltransferase [Acidimicrobiia bacterium]|nr:UbiA family prenyltransferase [Acidimicrobiia bacterium]